MTDQNQKGLELLLNSVQPAKVNELIDAMGVITASTPQSAEGAHAKYYIISKSQKQPVRGQKIIVIPTEVRAENISAIYYPLDEIETKLTTVEQEFHKLQNELQTHTNPKQEVQTFCTKLAELDTYLTKYAAGKSILSPEEHGKAQTLEGTCGSLLMAANDLSHIIEIATAQTGSANTIFSKPIPATILSEYAEDEVGMVTPQIGDILVQLDPTKTDCQFYPKDLIHYLTGEIKVRLTNVDGEGIVHAELAAVPSEAAIKYLNYLKNQALNNNEVGKAKELFEKIQAFGEYRTEGHDIQNRRLAELSQDAFLNVQNKHQLLIARGRGRIRSCNGDEYAELAAHVGASPLSPCGNKMEGGILYYQQGRDALTIMAFTYLAELGPPSNFVIDIFLRPPTNLKLAERILAEKLAEQGQSGFPAVMNLRNMQRFDKIYLLTENRLTGAPIPGVVFGLKRDRQYGCFINEIQKPEIKLPL